MARVLKALALCVALASALVQAQLPPNAAFCSSASSYTPAIIVNNGFMALYEDSASSSNCVRLGLYGVDLYGNVTFNEIGTDGCYSTDVQPQALTYDNKTNTFMSIQQVSYYSSTVYNLTYTACTPIAGSQVTSSSSSTFTTGTYCGAWNETIVAHNRALVLVSGDCATASNGYVVQTGLSDTGVTSCRPTGAISTGSINFIDYDPSTQIIGLSYTSRWGSPSTLGATNTFSSDSCITSEDAIPVLNSPYCVDAAATSTQYRGASFVRTSATTFTLSVPYEIDETKICVTSGRIATRGRAVALVFDTANSNGYYCYFGTYYSDNLPRLVFANFSMTANSLSLHDSQGNQFTASTCPQVAVPNGLYCAGRNAQLYVANQTYLLTGDVGATTPLPCQINGVFYPQAMSSFISDSNIQQTNCSVTIKSITYTNNTLYFVYRRGDVYPNPVEAYAFTQGSCSNATQAGINTTLVPSGDYCLGAAGEFGALHVDNNGSFAMVNNNSWAADGYTGPCTYVGTMNQRGGQVSYTVTSAGCKNTALYSNTPSFLRDVTFADNQFHFTKENTTDNTTLTTSTCPAGNASVLPNSWYCSANGGKLFVSADKFFYTSPNGDCFVQYTLTDSSNGTISLQQESYSGSYGSCVVSYAYNNIKILTLPSGDLSIPGQYLQNRGQNLALSASACTSTAAPTNDTVSYCGSFGDADDTRISMMVDAVKRYSAVVITSKRVTSPCVGLFMSNVYSTSMDLAPQYSSNCNSYWQPRMIARDAANGALTMYFTDYYGDNAVNVSLTANSCAAGGVTNGHYCGSLASPLSGTLQDAYIFDTYAVFGSLNYIVFANYTVAGTNLTSTAGNSWYWTPSSGSAYTGWPADTYVNIVGTRGLSVSGASYYSGVRFSAAASLDSCPANITANYTSAVLTSGTIAALNGAVTAQFANGQFSMLLPNGQTDLTKRCFVTGWYYQQANQLTLQSSQQTNCDFPWEISAATMAADGSITFNLWYPSNVTATVTLTAAGCTSATGLMPVGTYCGDGMIATVCSGEVFYNMFTFGNISTTTNGTIVAYVYNLGGSSYNLVNGTLLSYDSKTGIVTNFDYFGKTLGYSSAKWCDFQALSMDYAYPTVGAYCGTSSVDQVNATLFVLPGGEFTLTYWPPVEASAVATRTSCTVIGGIWYSISNQLASFELQEWNNNCLLGASSSYYAPPRVRFTTATVNNATGAITMTGLSWTSLTATATPITLTFGPTCASRNDQNSLAAQLTPLYTRGLYVSNVSGSGLYSALIMAGNMYALGTWRFGDVAVGAGKYTPRPRDSAATAAGILSFTDYIGFYDGQVYNSSYTSKSVLQLSMRFASGANPVNWDGNGSPWYVTLPLAFSGATPVDVAYNGAANDSGSKTEEKSKTGIIVGVIIAIVVVIAIVAFIVVRSSSSRSSTSDQQGGQDYRPMNGV